MQRHWKLTEQARACARTRNGLRSDDLREQQGKTDESKLDLARLALIRQQREDAAKKRAEEVAAKKPVAAAKK